MLVGTGLRLWGLADKPLWTDEFATLVFSLGHSFQTVPLDQVISLDTLLAPVQQPPSTSASQVVTNLLSESNHPPLYFVLTHLWLRLWNALGGQSIVLGVRSLSVLFGVLAIPATYGLAWMASRSQRVAQFATGLMTLSPFAVYLSQEARHYTLPILWILASLALWLQAVRSLQGQRRFTIPEVALWISINTLGIATHYFFTLTLLAEAIALLVVAIAWRSSLQKSALWRILAAMVGTAAGGAVWLPWLLGAHDSELTRWIYQGDRSGLGWLDPLGQAIAGWITMLYLLPIQAASTAVVVGSALGLAGLAIWTVWLLGSSRSGLGQGLGTATPEHPPSSGQVLVLLVAIAVLIFLGITYGLGMDLTSAFRYSFVYFPAVLVAIAIWVEQSDRPVTRWGLSRPALIILMAALLGSLTVVTNLGYQKTHRPDRVVEAMYAQTPAQTPAPETLVAIAHRTHGQTGRLMAIAWDIQQRYPVSKTGRPAPQFLLAHQQQPIDAAHRLDAVLSDRPRPLELWLINMQTVPPRRLEAVLADQACLPMQDAASVDGYRYQPFECR
ncbi:MAG: glycosyltransferase [Leptolyngbya sp. DLM2.Bin15]|nr:MAG: glycosyltransferase [Leptolyngbya sp. DLM2.Bin15]